MSTNTPDDGSESPDVAPPTNDADGTVKPDGLGDDGTIPNHPDGIAAGVTADDSHFNAEEDTPTD